MRNLKSTGKVRNAKRNPLVETVFAFDQVCKSKRSFKKRPESPLHEFICRLLYRTVSPHYPNQTVRKLSKLPWSNEDAQRLVAERRMAVNKMRFNTLSAIVKVALGF